MTSSDTTLAPAGTLGDLFTGDVAPTDPAAGEPLSFDYTGRGRDIVGLTIKNALLNIVTLTLYRFWGRTDVRRHVLSRTLINGEPMEYTGTGWEMFKGFLIVVFGVFLPASGLVLATQFFAPMLFPVVFAAVYLGFFFLINVAVYAARRYRFSRTSWRGVRFAMDGSAVNYSWAAIGYGFLSGITFGWFTPAAQMRLSRRMWEETLFGARRIKIVLPSEGLAGPTYGPFALMWFGLMLCYIGAGALLVVAQYNGFYNPYAPDDLTSLAVIYGIALVAVVIVSLFSIPYQAAIMRRTAEMIGIDYARFRLDAKSGSLLWLFFSNALILILSLGFAEPVATTRTFRYVFKRLSSTGNVNFEAIRQAKTRGPGTGEGLADAFDVGGF